MKRFKLIIALFLPLFINSEHKVQTQLKPKDLKSISQDQIDQHWSLYEGYVKQVNDLQKQMKACKNKSEIRRRYGFEYNGMVLHELYFQNMKKNGGKVSKELENKLKEEFGSFDDWKTDFINAGKTRGIGWVITYIDPDTQSMITQFVEDHEIGNITGYIPIIVMDVWEHAYMVDHGASGRGDYITAFLDNLNWEIINKRYKESKNKKINSRFIK